MIRQAIRQKTQRGEIASVKALPAPTGGWISQENITAGKPNEALILDNIIPYSDTADLRGGFESFCNTGATDPVETIMVYNGQDGVTEKFAACGDTIYDVTTATASATSITGVNSTRYQYVNFVNSGSTFVWAANGEDDPVYYNGSAWITASITGLTGLSPSDIISPNVFKGRIYCAFKNSMKFGYLATGAIQGAMSTFELGAEFSKGGYLMAMATWTRDGGSGVDDFAVFLTSEGQVAVYQGSDPSDPDNWAKVGIYNLPRPIGRRCTIEVASDVFIVTESGLIPLSKSLNVGAAATEGVAVSDNIKTAMNRAARLYRGNFGWQVQDYPKGTLAVMNVPLSEGEQSHQYVMNTVTGSWCRFTGMNAICWALAGGNLYFGGADGVVYLYDDNGSDNGGDILADYKSCFSYFGESARNKHWKQVQPILYADDDLTPSIGLNVDFEDGLPSSTPIAGQSSAIYLGYFDLGDEVLPSSVAIRKNWASVEAPVGRAAAVRMRLAYAGETATPTMQIMGVNVMFERGAIG